LQALAQTLAQELVLELVLAPLQAQELAPVQVRSWVRFRSRALTLLQVQTGLQLAQPLAVALILQEPRQVLVMLVQPGHSHGCTTVEHEPPHLLRMAWRALAETAI
jgi:hypothetical protein